MRLVIKDYLLQLKEKDELDLLLCDLLLQMGYVMDHRPKTGNRQYGVDIYARNSKEALLCVVKQGDLTRSNWDVGPNAVRPSLNEIHDCFIRMLGDNILGKQLRVVVATNGIQDEAVRPDWEGFVAQNATWNGIPVSIEFWGIDSLVVKVQKYLLSEHVFDGNMQSLLRKALYFVDEGDYHNKHFESIIDGFLDSINYRGNAKSQEKKLAGLYLASQMIAHYAAESRIFKIAIMVTEYLLIRYWRFLFVHGLFETPRYIRWLHKFIKAYEKWNQEYYVATKECANDPNCFPVYNSVEQRVQLYDTLGYWVSYAYWLSFVGKYSQTGQKKCHQICNSIVNLANHYPQIFYPPYDCHIGIMSMLFRLFLRIGRTEDVCALIRHLSNIVAYNYLMYKKYPAPDDSYETAVNIALGLSVPQYQCSAFWGTMLEWIVVTGQNEVYQSILPVLKDNLKEVTKCVWFLRAEEELLFYDRLAMNRAGEGTSFDLEGSFDQLEKIVRFVFSQYEKELFSYEVYSFNALEFIICRYYGYLPRVFLDTKE